VLAPTSVQAQTTSTECAPDSENFVPAICGHVFLDQPGGEEDAYDEGEGVSGVQVVVKQGDLEVNSTLFLECSPTDCGYYSFNMFEPGSYTFCVLSQDADAVCKAVDITSPSQVVDIEVGDSGDSNVDDDKWGDGTGTPGYWKNHSEAWPVDSLTIGGVKYTKEAILSWMGKVGGDKRVTMFSSLSSAMLNSLLHNNHSCIDDTVLAANQWMGMWVGAKVPAKSDAWVGSATVAAGEPLHQKMDDYNNGLLCAPHRD